jgi:hypothetical protein
MCENQEADLNRMHLTNVMQEEDKTNPTPAYTTLQAGSNMSEIHRSSIIQNS